MSTCVSGSFVIAEQESDIHSVVLAQWKKEEKWINSLMNHATIKRNDVFVAANDMRAQTMYIKKRLKFTIIYLYVNDEDKRTSARLLKEKLHSCSGSTYRRTE